MSARVTNAVLVAKLEALERSVTAVSDATSANTARLDQLCAELEPVTQAYQNISGARRALIWIAGALGGTAAALVSLREISKFFKHL